MIWALLIACLAALAAASVPLGAALGLTGFAVLAIYSDGALSLAANEVWKVFTTTTLTAIPLFVLIGELLLQSRISERVYAALMPLFRRVPGGLLHTNIVVSTVFGAVSGSSMSVAAAVGAVAFPELSKRGYRPALVVATLAAGGTLGLLIPPSLSLLIYGALTDTSIGRLFMAGVVPGLMLSVAFLVWIAFASGFFGSRTGTATPATPDAEPVRFSQVAGSLFPVVLLIVAVLGSIFGGLATPTEAAGIGCVAAAGIGAASGELTFGTLSRAILRATRTFASIGFVIAGATILSQAVRVTGLPQQLVGTVAELGLSPLAVLVIVIGIYLLLGTAFEGLSMMVMTLPVVFPLLTGMGYDPVWLGVLVTLMIEVALITPPVGLNLFVLLAVTENKVGLGAASRACLPFWAIILLGAAIITAFPGLVLWLPNRLF